jgi:S-adenosylmethionine hydrolase
MSIVTLTTDFGVADGYVGVMKGVILSIAPDARLVDLSHAIPAQDVRRAAYVLHAAAPFFSAGTIHLAVVDPGVGTERRAIAVWTPAGMLVGPDNGLFTYVMVEAPEWRAVAFENPGYHLTRVSATFHGRDIFAPVAGHLAAGVPLSELGPPVTDPLLLPLPRLDVSPGRLEGVVVHVDRFGNLITSVGRLAWEGKVLELRPAFRPEAAEVRFYAGAAQVDLGEREIVGVRRTYGEVPVGHPVVIVGSSGFLEVAARQGSAAEVLGVDVGDPVVVSFRPV